MPKPDEFDFGEEHGYYKGRKVKNLKKSEQIRTSLMKMFPGPADNPYKNFPSSVMRAKRVLPTDEPSKKRNTGNTVLGKWNSKDVLSGFPQNIGRAVVLVYSKQGQTVFDPFAGHNSRMDLVVAEGRNYIGCDLSKEFMEYNRKKAKKLRRLHPSLTIDLHHTDSRKVPVNDQVGDFTLTSPPYYDIEYYGDEPEQLGKCATYKLFLEGIEQVLRENFRCLKPGAFACWFINDFRRKKKFHCYHADIIRHGRKAGFTLHDIMIVDFGFSPRDAFIQHTVTHKILPKRHEYCVVFRKPF